MLLKEFSAWIRSVNTLLSPYTLSIYTMFHAIQNTIPNVEQKTTLVTPEKSLVFILISCIEFNNEGRGRVKY